MSPQTTRVFTQQLLLILLSILPGLSIGEHDLTLLALRSVGYQNVLSKTEYARRR